MLAWTALSGAVAPGSVETGIEGLRSAKGQILACITTRPASFPDCQSDPLARHLTVAAAVGALHFDDLPSGDYAIALIHDENGNKRLDTLLGIPREGFGFSRNPKLGFGPPSFDAASFGVNGGTTDQKVRVRYLL